MNSTLSHPNRFAKARRVYWVPKVLRLVDGHPMNQREGYAEVGQRSLGGKGLQACSIAAQAVIGASS